jgi:hypothetical protein
MANIEGSPQRQPMVTGLFNDRDSAERAYESLPTRGYSERDINLAMSDDTRKRYFAGDAAETELGSKAAKGAGVGGAVGATVGAIAAAIAAVGSSLVGWGIPEERLKHYEAGIKKGGIVMGVTPRTDEDAEYFEREWKSSNGEHVYR